MEILAVRESVSCSGQYSDASMTTVLFVMGMADRLADLADRKTILSVCS